MSYHFIENGSYISMEHPAWRTKLLDDGETPYPEKSMFQNESYDIVSRLFKGEIIQNPTRE